MYNMTKGCKACLHLCTSRRLLVFMMYYHLYYKLIHSIAQSEANTNSYVKNSYIKTLL